MPELQSTAAQVRYMYCIDETHICVQNIQSRKYNKMIAADFRAYHRQQDPCASTMALYRTKSTKGTQQQKSRKAPTISKTIQTTTALQKMLKQARQYPDAKNGQRHTTKNLTSLKKWGRLIGKRKHPATTARLSYQPR